MPNTQQTYEVAFANAMEILHSDPTDCGVTSALRQAAHDQGIAWGEDMGKFMAWANEKLKS